MKQLLVIITIAIFYPACKSIRMNVDVPDQFAANATQMKVSGLTGKRRQQLSFGNYQTSKVKAGWIVASGGNDRNSRVTTQERLLKVFNLSRDMMTTNTKNKYQYTIQDGNGMAEVFCLEKASKETVTTKTRMGEFGITKNFQYSFSAAILPQTIKDEPWQLVFYNNFDSRKDTAHKFWDRPYIERKGYVTNGKIRIDIRPILADKTVNQDGKQSKTLIRLLMAYELKIDGGLIGVIDVFNNNVWIYNDLDKDMKLIVASVSSAILMRRLDEGKI
jgi:hypothetical protein